MSDESLEPSSTNPTKSLTSLATPLVLAESGLTSIDSNRMKALGENLWQSLQDTFEQSVDLVQQEVNQQYHQIHDQVETELEQVKQTIETIPQEISRQVDSAITDAREKSASWFDEMKEKVDDYQLDERIESSFDSLKHAFDVFK